MRTRSLLVLPLLVAALPLALERSAAPGERWTLEDERDHVERLQDPDWWDLDRMGMEKQVIDLPMEPLPYGAWPVPAYDPEAHGHFTGVASAASDVQLDDGRWLLGDVASVGRLAADEPVVFFALFTVSDGPRDGASPLISSRNHPHPLVQGVRTPRADVPKRTIEYVAFADANEEGWAIVNLRLFDLRVGRAVLVRQLEDGTLRSRQVALPDGPVEGYAARLLQDEDCATFVKD
ncbi:MAG: hypothetical protein AAGB93_24260 [Planctomycetota bacterium]